MDHHIFLPRFKSSISLIIIIFWLHFNRLFVVCQCEDPDKIFLNLNWIQKQCQSSVVSKYCDSKLGLYFPALLEANSSFRPWFYSIDLCWGHPQKLKTVFFGARDLLTFSNQKFIYFRVQPFKEAARPRAYRSSSTDFIPSVPPHLQGSSKINPYEISSISAKHKTDSVSRTDSGSDLLVGYKQPLFVDKD